MSIKALPAPKLPISGRLSTVKRAMKSPPGNVSPLGNVGNSSGSLALLSPSKWLPALSMMSSLTVSGQRSTDVVNRIEDAIWSWQAEHELNRGQSRLAGNHRQIVHDNLLDGHDAV